MSGFKNNIYYGWIIVAAFFIMGTVLYGTLTSFGVFFKSIEGEFGLTRTATSAIFSVQNVFGATIAFFGGWAADRYGPKIIILLIGAFSGLSLLLTSQTNAIWQLFLTYSLLFSAIGANYTVLASTVSRWFDKNRGLALGLAGSGVGLGVVVIAPLATYLISDFGWRLAYIIIGSIIWLIVIPLSLTLKLKSVNSLVRSAARTADSRTISVAKQADASKKYSEGTSLQEAIGTRNFWLMASAWFLHSFCYFLVLIHIVPHATDIGILPMEAATVLILLGAVFIAGRILMGRITDIIGSNKTAIICALIMALAMIWLILSKDLFMLYIFGAVFGFACGGLDTSIAALVGNTFGTGKIGTIMGTLQASWGLGMIIGPAVAGLIFDINSSYFLALVLGTAAMLMVPVLVALIRRDSNQSLANNN
jgi:MFS transporter, OFA family, oxalate/formate antiporter